MYSITLNGVVVSLERFNNFENVFRNFELGQLDNVT
jgi:hypothetical protein